MVRRRWRLGMVGGGSGAFIGAVHRIAARLDDRYELVAGALSADPSKAHASARELGIAPDRSYESFVEMAKRESAREDGIDVVAIVTPNHVHYPAARAFVDSNIHVICDKPLTSKLSDAVELAGAVMRSGVLFALTHNYTGYPLVRQARALVAAGELGAIRVVQVEYPQDWLTTRLESTGQKQADWRTDPERSGAGGCVGDIGTHAAQLAEFITGLQLEAVCAQLSTFVEGRALDDDCQMLLRYSGGARGMLWASQVAPGNENNLKIRIFGERGSLTWRQENPNQLWHAPLGEAPRLVTRGGPGAGPSAAHGTRIPPGHPEGYLEGFANIYADVAELLSAREEQREPNPEAQLVPGVLDGVRGMKFIHAAVESSRRGGEWVSLLTAAPTG